VSTLSQLQQRAKHDLLVVSDADVRVPGDCLAQLLAPFQEPAVGLVCHFYRLANPTTLAMRWEALAVNADFWPGVLQSLRFGPLSYALGAAMAVRRSHLEALGGFEALASYLADDFELGSRVARLGARLELCPVVVDCWEPKQGWGSVWKHQLRWARTIRVCMPGPYAASLISNATLWPLLWCLAGPGPWSAGFLALCLLIRVLTAADNQRRLTASGAHWVWCWMAPLKDLLQLALWCLSFLGSTIDWRGTRFKVLPGGQLIPD
jgi:ceramide glucosyltransferase